MPRLIGPLILALIAASAAGAEPSRWHDVSRVVVFGDVHGAYSELTELLEAVGVIDEELHWSGDATHLVSLGDLLDRGPQSRHVIDLLMRLGDEAAERGGQVHVVLGNHELMNLLGDLRYVSATDYAAFAPDETAEMRADALARFAAHAAEGTDESALLASFDQRYPAGYFAHEEAFGIDGRYGSWLLTLPSILVIDDTAFVHGGLPPLVGATDLDTLNETIRTDVQRYLELRPQLVERGILPPDDKQKDLEIAQAALQEASAASEQPLDALEEFVDLGNADVLGANGPLWYRGTEYCKPIFEASILDASLSRLDVSRVVVGHTPTETRRAHEIYGGKVLMLDTGMLASYYRGRPAALIIENGKTSVQYLAPAERLPVESGGRFLDAGLSRAELVGALQTADIVSIDRSASEAFWRVGLAFENRTLTARFIPDGSGDSAADELAAFALDELLGTELVPPTVERQIDADSGALQLILSDGVTETQRIERHLNTGAWCPMNPQYQLMYAFDLLADNRGRTADNLIYREDLSDLLLVNFSGAFGSSRQLPAGLDSSAVALAPPMRSALMKLDEQLLEVRLAAWLDKRERRALLSRRDRILEAF